jgi:hypothetical protein
MVTRRKYLENFGFVVQRFIKNLSLKPQSHVRTRVNLVGFLYIWKLKGIGRVLDEIAVSCKLFQLCQELMVITAIVE